MGEVIACNTCGLIQEVAEFEPGTVDRCAQCDFILHRHKPNSRRRTAALASAALILYVPANYYPLVSTTYWGAYNETTIYDGIRGLFQAGSYAVGILVLITSVISPLFKILGLLYLSLASSWRGSPKARSRVYKTIEIIGPWNMLEVFLLAIAVAIAELGHVATVLPGPGVFSFAALVVVMLLATHAFDERVVWENVSRKEATA
jgi:paraquat-inducible protein A